MWGLGSAVLLPITSSAWEVLWRGADVLQKKICPVLEGQWAHGRMRGKKGGENNKSMRFTGCVQVPKWWVEGCSPWTEQRGSPTLSVVLSARPAKCLLVLPGQQ